ncbi:MAG: CBS domain-containing protein [Methylophilaceae bacterium]
MLIRTILPTVKKRLVTINGDAPLIDAARLLGGMHTNLVVVCDPDGLIIGVITKTDVVKQISHCQGCSCTTMVSETMTRDVMSCNVDDNLLDVWHIMKDKGLRQIPVKNTDSKPVGVLYARDALQVLLKEVEYEEILLRNYVMGID